MPHNTVAYPKASALDPQRRHVSGPFPSASTASQACPRRPWRCRMGRAPMSTSCSTSSGAPARGTAWTKRPSKRRWWPCPPGSNRWCSRCGQSAAALKTKLAHVSEIEAEALRSRVKADELEAERLQHQALERLARPDLGGPVDPAPAFGPLRQPPCRGVSARRRGHAGRRHTRHHPAPGSRQRLTGPASISKQVQHAPHALIHHLRDRGRARIEGRHRRRNDRPPSRTAAAGCAGDRYAAGSPAASAPAAASPSAPHPPRG